MSRSSRTNQQNNMGQQQQSPSPQNAGGQGGLPYGVNVQFTRKAVILSGPAIQTVSIPITRQQTQQQQGAQPAGGNNWQGQGKGSMPNILSACLLAAQTQDTITAQQLALFQQSQKANQQLLGSLTKIANQVGMAMQTPPTRKQRQDYQAPQDIHAQQQARGQKQTKRQQQLVFAGS